MGYVFFTRQLMMGTMIHKAQTVVLNQNHFYGESLVCGGVCLGVSPQGRFFTVLFNMAKRNISRSLCKYHCSGAEEKMNLDYYLPILSLTFAMLRWEYVPTGK